jgi:16S rRNA (cytosine967-C5)-methyltransferase
VEINETRLDRLRENLDRLRLDARLINADVSEIAAWWDGQSYQRILLDVPCSATGVIRRHPDIKVLRRASDIDALAHRQRILLESLWPLLEKGGCLLYSSCSILRAENQSQIECFLKNQKDAELLPASDSLTTQIEERLDAAPADSGLQLLPGRVGADGFFYALIKKLT